MRLLSLSVAAIAVTFAVAGCSKVDPAKPLKEDQVKAALKLFSKKEITLINQMGGPSYLVGKTVDNVKANLPEDYANFKADEYIEAARIYREQNLDLAKQGALGINNVKVLQAANDNEKKIAINEAKAHNAWLSSVKRNQNPPPPQPMITPAQGTMACGDFQSAVQMKNPQTKESVKTRLVSRKVCRALPKAAEYYIRDTKNSEKNGTFYKIKAGWIPASSVIARTSEAKLAEMKAQQAANFEKMIANPPAHFYTRLRPMIDISPQNLSRLLAAENAIAAIAEKDKCTWDEASKKFIALQLRISKAEAKCVLNTSCEDLVAADRELAKLLTAKPSPNFKKEPLSCEILPIAGCKKLLSEEEFPSRK